MEPRTEDTIAPLSEQEAQNVIALLALRKRRIAPLPEPRLRAWDRRNAIAETVTAAELRDAYRTLKEAYRRQDPHADVWRDAFHRKLEAFLNG